ncbi:hypothetical protein ACH44C_21505 [Streptomyces purpureus]|uniref:hypothetical protein n=1 Tax=Streptomyces purpureus TaxID=1951 RepID=UPI0037A3CD5F
MPRGPALGTLRLSEPLRRERRRILHTVHDRIEEVAEQERRTAATLTAERSRGVDDPIALFVAGARAYLEGTWTTGGSADSSWRTTAPRGSTPCAASGTARGSGATPGS